MRERIHSLFSQRRHFSLDVLILRISCIPNCGQWQSTKLAKDFEGGANDINNFPVSFPFVFFLISFVFTLFFPTSSKKVKHLLKQATKNREPFFLGGGGGCLFLILFFGVTSGSEQRGELEMLTRQRRRQLQLQAGTQQDCLPKSWPTLLPLLMQRMLSMSVCEQ